MGAKKNNRKRAIILNHMFTGNYLEDNIGHEIVNLFSDDESFARSLEPHAQVDYNFSVMQKRFVRAINKCKGTNITLNKIKNEII